MVLSEAVYSTSLEEVSPLVKGAGKFTFDQLIQATLLDVIDRGNCLYRFRMEMQLV